jgi:beta-galactosidase
MLKNEGQDAMPITVRALDAKGRPVTVCNEMIEFEVSGSVKIIGLGNGDPNSHESEKGNKRSLFNGLAQIIIQSVENGKAGVTLTAKAKGLKPASINIPLQVVEPIAAVIPEEMNKRVMNLNKWSLSPEFTERPNPLMKVADNDMNSWRPINTGQLSKVSVGKYVILRCSFTRYKQQQTGGKIVFENIFGIAEIWLNDKKLAEKTKVESADLSIDLPAESNKYSLNILIRNPQSSKLGLEGEVRVIGNNSKKVPYVN